MILAVTQRLFQLQRHDILKAIIPDVCARVLPRTFIVYGEIRRDENAIANSYKHKTHS